MLQPEPVDHAGYLLNNLCLFGRLLRRVGIPVSTAQLYNLGEALTLINPLQREDFYLTSRAFLVHNHEQYHLFRTAFDLFWNSRFELLFEFGQAHAKQLSAKYDPGDDRRESNRSRQTAASISLNPAEAETDDSQELHVSGVYSPREILRRKDFAAFTAEEFDAAKDLIQSLQWRMEWNKTRRKVHASKRSSYLDLRRAVRKNMINDGEIIQLAWNRRKYKPRPLVIICDISGSMERYSRIFLHFMYAMVQNVGRVEAFVFGTRLTRITPALRYKDVDTVLDRVSRQVLDWSGGTRIGDSLRSFNYQWARRVLGRGAVLVILSDGWDRGDTTLLGHEMSRLQRSVSKLIWLNPLLGSSDYQPLVRGIQTVLPYVDEFLPFHNLESMQRFARQASLKISRKPES